jgi:hypothetical protein
LGSTPRRPGALSLGREIGENREPPRGGRFTGVASVWCCLWER